ncbi:hypothetical protein FKM82_004187 [Ascaphus truei]
MKEHRKTLHRKRGRLLVLSKVWTTQFGGFRKYNFLQKRQNVFQTKNRIINSGSSVKVGLCKSEQHRSKISVICKKGRPAGLAAKANARRNSFKRIERLHRGLPWARKFCSLPSQRVILSKRKKTRLRTTELVNDEETCVTARDLLNNPICRCSIGNKNISTLQKKDNFQTPKDESDSTIVIFRSLKKNHPPLLKQKCFGSLWIKINCHLFSRGKVPLFMMHKKLSVFTVRCRLSSQKLRARNRSFKLAENNRLFQKVSLNSCRKTLRGKFHKAISSLKSNIQRTVQDISSLSDMNNNTSGKLCENQQCASNSCLRDETVKLQCVEAQILDSVSSKPLIKNSQNQLHETATQWENGELIPRKLSEIPAVNSYHDDVYILVTEKEISISCQEDMDVQTGDGDELMLLAPDKVQLCVNENVGSQENIPVESSDYFCHMEVDDSTNFVFNTKLLDHPYCKSPPQDPSAEETLDVSEIQGIKNGQKIISCVPDEQLASCVCGLLNEIIKKYGSLIPLSERDLLTRLKEVFNEDFSNRTSFISKEIMKYRAKHSKATLCNFRIFYNKHMLDMDDLATLDGQNWLNDQVINMYGELIVDAVPDKVHFLNSFFHRQLVTKGYNGVKRWTKKVDFFKKTLLLIPIHLEVHWSLITVNIPNKIISFYDSQGIHFKFCVENIRKYLLTEAREKNHPEFLQGWQTAVTKCIPQQKNDSDCGVFVLQPLETVQAEVILEFLNTSMTFKQIHNGG